MDPVACIQRLQGALEERDWPEAVQALADYYQWRLAGGVEPVVRLASPVATMVGGDTIVSRLAAELSDKLEGVGV